MSSEVSEKDGAPIRVRLLGEDLVAYRDSTGRVGVLDEHCPHRGASLVLARNEECGLRCLYHGWKIDADGTILDMPAEPEGSPFKDRIKHIAYPTEERGGLVWVYMGPRDKQPPFPEFDWTTVPEEQRLLVKVKQDCNWLQCVEGNIDSAHASILHAAQMTASADVSKDTRLADGKSLRPSADLAPRLEIQNTSFGFHYAALRKPMVEEEANRYVRVVPFAAPFYIWIPSNNFFAQVPIDDYQTCNYLVVFSKRQALDDQFRTSLMTRLGVRPGIDVDSDFWPILNVENSYRQDRSAMRAGHFSGISGLLIEDYAVQETMGPIYDRTREHLGASDLAVVRARRLLLDSVRRVQDGGDPLGLDQPVDFGKIRSSAATISVETAWQTLVPGHVVLEAKGAELA
jgi:phthalate 4,5-dioxygenase oxygenase subunit